MPPDPPQLSAEELLRQFRWMRPLARSLVRDEAGAEDLVQESWLTFLKRPPQDPLARSSWLRKVLFNFALRRRRADRNRDRRERLAARPGRQDSSPAQLLERAELHRQVVNLVLGLEEPHRSTILYRFFDELTPAEIARRQGLPVTTVRSRIAKALERLRSRLDREHGGGRTGWCIALAPLAGLELASAGPVSAAPGLSAPSAPSAAVLETWKTISSGGILVTTKKLTLALVVSAVVLLGLGGVFYTADHWRAPTAGEREVGRLKTAAGPEKAVGSRTLPPVADQPATPASAAERSGDERPISIQGRVVGPGGRGIPGARVAAIDARAWRDRKSTRLTSSRLAI